METKVSEMIILREYAYQQAGQDTKNRQMKHAHLMLALALEECIRWQSVANVSKEDTNSGYDIAISRKLP